MGGLAHRDHGVVWAIDAEVRGNEPEDDGARNDGDSGDGPMPPFGFGVAEVFPAGPAGAEFTDEPAGGADDEDGGEGDDAGDIAIGGEGFESFFELVGIEFGEGASRDD